MVASPIAIELSSARREMPFGSAASTDSDPQTPPQSFINLVASGLIFLGATAKDCLFYFGDCASHLNAARASVGAVEGCAATPYALFVVQNVEANLCTFIA